jgi:hypothetical protein
MLPEERRYSRKLPVSELNVVSPNMNGSSQIVPANVPKVLLTVMTHDPAVMRNLRLSNFREIPFNDWILFCYQVLALLDFEITNIAF